MLTKSGVKRSADRHLRARLGAPRDGHGPQTFAKASYASLVGAILKEEPPSVSSLPPGAPPALDHVVAKCLAKDPDERWQSAVDVASELRWIAQDSHAGGAAIVSPRRWPRERLGWITAAAFALVEELSGRTIRSPCPRRGRRE